MDLEMNEMTRRSFLQAGAAGLLAAGPALAGTAGSAGAAPAAAEGPRPSGRPRIGAVSWCFHGFESGADPEESLDILGEIGFEGTELIANARADLRDFWTDEKIGRLKGRLEKNKLEVAQFVLFQPVVEGLSSLDPEERKRSVDFFEAGCKIGKKIGAPRINIVAPWARELQGEGYIPRYGPKPGEKYHLDLAPGFDWERIWSTWVETVRACLERAKAHGLQFTIEHHTHCLVPDADAFLRLWDAIRDPALGYNMDVGWTLLQREYPPVAIHKTKGRLMNLHMRDIDGTLRTFVHVGEGVMDFKAIADALQATGFRGFLSIEQDKHPGDMKATCRRYLAILKEHLS